MPINSRTHRPPVLKVRAVLPERAGAFAAGQCDGSVFYNRGAGHFSASSTALYAIESFCAALASAVNVRRRKVRGARAASAWGSVFAMPTASFFLAI